MNAETVVVFSILMVVAIGVGCYLLEKIVDVVIDVIDWLTRFERR